MIRQPQSVVGGAHAVVGLVSFGAVLLSCANVHAQARIEWVGGLTTAGNGGVNAVSDDGRVAVGQWASDTSTEAFVWYDGSGILGIGDFPGGRFSSSARGVSADGQNVVGGGYSADGGEAFAWHLSSGLVSLGDPSGRPGDPAAWATNAEGDVVVGEVLWGLDSEAFRWTPAGGMVLIGDLVGGELKGKAFAVSSDGDVVVGSGGSAAYQSEALRWTSAEGMTGLGVVSGQDYIWSAAYAVSADGRVVVGACRSADTTVGTAFRWTAEAGMESIGDLSMGRGGSATARAVTADGSLIVGSGYDADFDRVGFLWTRRDGIRSLVQALLEDYGFDASAFQHFYPHAVSPDGRVMGGGGTRDGTIGEGWVLFLPARCEADCNKDRRLNVNDFICVQAKWRSKTAYGDYNGDGRFTVNDFVAFQSDFVRGCE